MLWPLTIHKTISGKSQPYHNLYDGILKSLLDSIFSWELSHCSVIVSVPLCCGSAHHYLDFNFQGCNGVDQLRLVFFLGWVDPGLDVGGSPLQADHGEAGVERVRPAAPHHGVPAPCRASSGAHTAGVHATLLTESISLIRFTENISRWITLWGEAQF